MCIMNICSDWNDCSRERKKNGFGRRDDCGASQSWKQNIRANECVLLNFVGDGVEGEGDRTCPFCGYM